MPERHAEWFAVDCAKRAAMARSRPVGAVLRELVANALDADAKSIALSCRPAPGFRRDRAGRRAYSVSCTDDGRGCERPSVLRTLGASTSDLHALMRGRFGQGLIDTVAACERAWIDTRSHRLAFDDRGCTITRTRRSREGLVLEAILRHPGDGFEDLAVYFASFVLPPDVTFSFNGVPVPSRVPERRIEGVRLPTVIFDPQRGRDHRCLRATIVELVPTAGTPTIHELGLPVDSLPWSLPYDANVAQKTPLDAERNVLPDSYRQALVQALVPHVSEAYRTEIERRGEVPPEIRDRPENILLLPQAVRDLAVQTTVGARPDRVVRRNPFDPDDASEAAELELRAGRLPINTGSLPEGIRTLLKDASTVAEAHDTLCKVRTEGGAFPPETPRQRDCLRMYAELAQALLGKPVRCDRCRGVAVEAAWGAGTMHLNIDVPHLWKDPLGEKSLGTILHELAHDAVSGRSPAFEDEVARLGGRLAGWIGEHPDWWRRWKEILQAGGPPA